MDGACSTYGERRHVYRIMVGKPEGKRPLGRNGGRWEGNIEVDFREMGCEGVNWTDPAQDKDRSMAVVNSETQIRGSIKCEGFISWLKKY